MRNYKFATAFVTIYLAVYTVLHNIAVSFDVISTMFFLSPLLVIWMVYTILKYGKYEGRELEENEEWGYADKSGEQLK